MAIKQMTNRVTAAVDRSRVSQNWDTMQSVDRREEEEHHEAMMHQYEDMGPYQRCWFASQGWILVLFLGFLSAMSGAFVEVGVEAVTSLRSGWCAATIWPHKEEKCPAGSWIAWGLGMEGFVFSVGLGVLFACVSACMVKYLAPSASGSGIPETKTILNGFVLADAVSLRTLIVKPCGLILSVSAGMALGKEGPMVHLAMCWAQLLSNVFPQYRNEQKRRELFSAAAAAGVSTAFGAPIGGVLFSLEEVSSHFPPLTLMRAFTAAVVAATTLSILNLTGSGHLTMFSVSYNTPFNNWELIAFVFLGAIGGLVGAAFNELNLRWSTIRISERFKRRCGPIMEVSLIALVTTFTSWWSEFTRPMMSEVIHGLFQYCTLEGSESKNDIRHKLGLCDHTGGYVYSWSLAGQLIAASFVRWFQMTLTFGTKCPAGLFVPSLYTGACLGRLVGNAVYALNGNQQLIAASVQPGIYAMVGAASVLGGVCRVTISLVVIMLELTGGTAYTVPFMLSILISKLVGDCFNEGIYDLHIVLKGYPFMHEELDASYTERCCDIMETEMTKIDGSMMPSVRAMRAMTTSYRFRGYPVLDGNTFVGYIKRVDVEEIVDKFATERGEDYRVTLQDLEPKTDHTVMRMVPTTSLAEAHKVFAQLGVQHIFIIGAVGNARYETLQGIITKKNFLSHLKTGKIGKPAEPSQSGPGGSARSVRRASTMARIVQSRDVEPDTRQGPLMRNNPGLDQPLTAGARNSRASGNSAHGSIQEGSSDSSDEEAGTGRHPGHVAPGSTELTPRVSGAKGGINGK